MREPKPLLREGATDFERQLLRSVAGERPSPRLQARMRRGLGLSGAVFWAGNAKAMFATLAGKAALGVTIAGLATVAGVATYRHLSAEPPVRELPADVLAAPVAPAPVPAVAVAPAPVLEPLASPEPKPVAAAEASADNGQLREEILLLDRARTALRQGSANRALSLLDDYRQRFPAGILNREAELLRQRSARGASSASHGPERQR